MISGKYTIINVKDESIVIWGLVKSYLFNDCVTGIQQVTGSSTISSTAEVYGYILAEHGPLY